VKLYTKTGDDGRTSLFDGTRVRKDHARVCSYGDVDELNAQLGVTRAVIDATPDAPAGVRELAGRLGQIQSDLFAIGAELATPPSADRKSRAAVSDADIARLEVWIDEASDAVPPLKSFVLPAGTLIASQLHVCRTVVRRAERHIVHLAGSEDVAERVVIYVNRLSDLFFAWARLANVAAGCDETPWRPGQ